MEAKHKGTEESKEGLYVPDAVVVTRGHTFENRANLPGSYLATMEDRYQGTRKGRQELEGEILEDYEGAFLRLADHVDPYRRQSIQGAEHLAQIGADRVAIGVDPSGGREEQGIVVCALGADGHIYVLPQTNAIRGGQAGIVVGFEDHRCIGCYEGAFLIRNSWGEHWGDLGYGWLPYKSLQTKMTADFWTVARADWLAAARRW